MSQFFASGGQSIGVLASVSVLPMNIQDWFPLGWTGCISMLSKGPQESFPTPQFKNINSLVLSFSIVQLSHPYMTIGKIIALTRQTFTDKVMSLLFNTLSRLVIAFLPRSKCLLISSFNFSYSHHLQWFWSSKKKKIKSVTVSILSPSVCHEVMGPDATILVFECWVLSQLFHSPFSFS